ANTVLIENDLPALSVEGWYAETFFDGSFTRGRLTYTVSNLGNAPAPPGRDVNLGLSPNDTIGDGDEIFLFFEEAAAVLPPDFNLFHYDTSPAAFTIHIDAFRAPMPTGAY